MTRPRAPRNSTSSADRKGNSTVAEKKEKPQTPVSSTSSSDKTKSAKGIASNGQEVMDDHVFDKTVCPDCKKLCKEDEQAVECECCERWFHKACQGVSDSLYQAIEEDSIEGRNMVHWYCNTSCNFFASKFMTNMKKGLDKVADQIEHVKRKVENIECGAMPTALENSVRNLVREELKKEDVEETLEKLESVKEIISKQDNFEDRCKQLESINKFMDDKAKEQELEMEDRRHRQTNLIIFKLPESNEQEIDDKIKEDRQRVEQILDEIGAESKPVFIKRLIGKKERVKRINRKSDSQQGASASVNDEIKMAPLLLKFGNQNARDEVLTNYIGCMRDGKEDNFEGEEERLYHTVNIQRDMTLKEREEDLRLYKELKDKREMSKNCNDQNAHWVRRFGRIINIGKYPRGRQDQRAASQ